MIKAWFLLYHGDHDMIDLYPSFVQEEDEEFIEAMENDDEVWVVDALADIYWTSLYMVEYTADKRTYDKYKEKMEDAKEALWDLFEVAMLEVIASNYSKTPSHDGKKIRKDENYFPPDLSFVLNHA